MGLRSLFKKWFASSSEVAIAQEEEIVWEGKSDAKVAEPVVETDKPAGVDNNTATVNSQITDAVTKAADEKAKPRRAKKTSNKVTTKKKSSVNKKK